MAAKVTLLAGEQMGAESPRAIQACNDYLRMGAGRSLEKLCHRYQNATESPPTKRLETLKDWSRSLAWQERAAAYDAAQDAAKTTEIQRLRTEGLAADFERIRELDEIYRKLKQEFTDKGLWYTDTKLSAKGDTVDVEVFNKPLLDTMRGVLDDLAKEVGGRKQRLEHTGKDDGPIQHEDVGLTDEDRAIKLAAIFEAARARRDRQAPDQANDLGAITGAAE